MVALVLLDTPFTAVAELRNGLATAIDPQTVDNWMVVSRFLMGGGGYAMTLLLAAGCIAFADGRWYRALRSTHRVKWRQVSRQEFDAFYQAYPRALEVDPPFDQVASRHSLKDLSLGGGRGGLVAECRFQRQQVRYRVREDLFLDSADARRAKTSSANLSGLNGNDDAQESPTCHVGINRTSA